MLLGAAFACRPSDRNAGYSVAVERTDTCLSNPAHTYEVFVPVHEKSGRVLPLLVAIDPHGSGKTATDHLKEAVSRYPAILVASNLIQNNDRNYVQQLDELIADVKKRFPAGERTFVVGFSGGARMALGYAMNHPVDGVIASGAFAGPDQLSAIKCPVMGLIGMDDFNFLETIKYIFDPASLPADAHIELTRASHAWPREDRLANVFGWFALSGVFNKRFDDQKVGRYVEEQKHRIDSLVGQGDFLQAAFISRNMASVNNFEKVGSFASGTSEITGQKAYNKQLARLSQSLQFEIKWRQIYGKALLEQNEAWWEKELSALHTKMTSETDDMMRMAYKRLSGFIGIACYSYARRFAAQKDIPHLEQILMVYRLAEPDNPDMQHFREELRKLKS